jgi:hypothetical protein
VFGTQLQQTQPQHQHQHQQNPVLRDVSSSSHPSLQTASRSNTADHEQSGIDRPHLTHIDDTGRASMVDVGQVGTIALLG